MAVATTAQAPIPEQVPVHPRLSVGMMGMYIFLASEVMFFGTLFAGYFYLLSSHSPWPPAGTHPVSWQPIPMINSVLLFGSGATCHVAHLAIQRGNRPRFFWWMLITILLGVGFEIGQAYEFIEKLAPQWIGLSGVDGMAFNANPFATVFFTMTGFHGLHVLGGLVILCILLWRFNKGQFSPRHHVGVAAGVIYWHFVDLVWLFLLIVLYFGVTFPDYRGA
ncbi:MAG: cytochrome c oxidase subunit 3 [Candidatus Dormibacteraeota bacterium]|nr:cytochrome c oxidase subunit 3 [Candidatus Dormibacteraeota bacterium]